MQLKYNEHVTLAEISADCKDVVLLAEKILLAIDAQKVCNELKARTKSIFINWERTADINILRHAKDAVEAAEDSLDTVVYIFSARKMDESEGVKAIRSRVKLSAARLERTLWDMAIPKNDKAIIKEMLNKIGVLMQFREDVPAPLRGGSYEKTTTSINGLLAFSHAFGYTFVRYEKGQMEKAWSVPLEELQFAIRHSKAVGINEACRLLQP